MDLYYKYKEIAVFIYLYYRKYLMALFGKHIDIGESLEKDVFQDAKVEMYNYMTQNTALYEIRGGMLSPTPVSFFSEQDFNVRFKPFFTESGEVAFRYIGFNLPSQTYIVVFGQDNTPSTYLPYKIYMRDGFEFPVRSYY